MNFLSNAWPKHSARLEFRAFGRRRARVASARLAEGLILTPGVMGDGIIWCRCLQNRLTKCKSIIHEIEVRYLDSGFTHKLEWSVFRPPPDASRRMQPVREPDL